MNSLRSYCDIYFTLQLQNQNFSEISKVKFLFLSPLPFLFPSSSSLLKPLQSSSLWNYGEALVQGHWWIPKSMYAQVANVKWAVCKNRGQTLVRHGLPCFLSKAIEPVGKEVRERKNFMSLVSQQIKITARHAGFPRLVPVISGRSKGASEKSGFSLFLWGDKNI